MKDEEKEKFISQIIGIRKSESDNIDSKNVFSSESESNVDNQKSTELYIKKKITFIKKNYFFQLKIITVHIINLKKKIPILKRKIYIYLYNNNLILSYNIINLSANLLDFFANLAKNNRFLIRNIIKYENVTKILVSSIKRQKIYIGLKRLEFKYFKLIKINKLSFSYFEI